VGGSAEMRPPFCWLVALVLTALVSGCAAAQGEDEPGVLVRRGLAHHQERRFEQAISWYRKAVEADRLWGEPHRLIGNALIAQGKLDEALAEYRAAVRKSPDNGEAWNDLGAALGRKRLFEEAEEALRNAARLLPRHAAPVYNQAKLLYQQERVKDAIEALRAALRIDSKYAPAHHALAVAYGRLRDWPEANRSAERAVEIDASRPEYLMSAAWSCYQVGFLERAEAHARKAGALAPKSGQPRFLLGLIALARGRGTDALEAYEAGIALATPGERGAAIGELRREMVTESLAPEAHFVLGLLLESDGKVSQAAEEFDRYVTKAPNGRLATRAREKAARNP